MNAPIFPPDSITFLDGGFGTLLQAAGLPPGVAPESWNVLHPEAVRKIHADYFAAGSDIVLANTFGANRRKFHSADCGLEEAIAAGVRVAREAADAAAAADGRRRRVALDVSSTGSLLKPAGDLSFDDAYEAFAEQVRLGAAAGADLVCVETMSDSYELKAAVLAAKENSDLPVVATVALGEDGKLLTGGCVESVAALLDGLGVDAAGFNCGLGPDLMLPYVRRFVKAFPRTVVAKPNAGMPKLVGGRTVFTVGPEEFARDVVELVAAGVSVVGGCCGTTPAHIAAARRALADAAPGPHVFEKRTVIASGVVALEFERGRCAIIGERINPTGKKKLKAALLEGDVDYVLREAVTQADAGADALDVNVGVPGIDEPRVLDETVQAVQGVSVLPLQIDTSSPVALERALRRYNGKALVNSVNGKEESMAAVFPLVAKYGGAVVALCLDESGIPPTAAGRLAVARKIVERGARYGLAPKDFLVDPLCLTVSADPTAAKVTLEAVRLIGEELGVGTVLGASNVSFGLPNRPELNAAFLTLAVEAGLTAAIYNPSAKRESSDPAAVRALLGEDRNCAEWIAAQAAAAPAPAAPAAFAAPAAGRGLADAIRRGLRGEAAAAASAALASGMAAVDVIDREVVPALEVVGRGFERGTVYLPQLLMAADAAGAAFDVIKAALERAPGAKGDADARRPPIVIATVKGDIHDIGKNIVRALLENYGFRVLDLGRDVPPERIVEAVKRERSPLVGLSALMTTTVPFMAETIKALKAAGADARVMVGGAVLTADYAAEIGADFYAKDAMGSVRIAEKVMGR